jgi:aerobic-type carbon monoxide dehydrogenase small subunit (CoxS/CutS family)
MRVDLTINGEPVGAEVDPLARLLDFLREARGLTGAKEGCGEGECGACSVLVDGVLTLSCLVPMGQLPGASVLTVEGLAGDGPLTAVQEALLAAGAAQCGICTPGIAVAVHALLAARPRPALDEIRTALAGNLCRCTGYGAIYRAVENATGGSPQGAGAPRAPRDPH